MISGGLSTPGIDFPPKMLSLSLGSSVIGGSLSDREPPPVLAVATPAQPGNYDWWGGCEGGGASASYRRKTQLRDTSISDGWTAAHPWEEGVNILLLSPLDHAYICKMFVHIRISLPSSAKFLRSQAKEILTNRLGKKSQTVPTQVDNVLARGPPGQNIRLFGSNLIDCFDSHLFSRTFCFALDGQIILLWYGCSKVIGFTLSNWRYDHFQLWICLLVGLAGYVRISTLLMICHQYPNSLLKVLESNFFLKVVRAKKVTKHNFLPPKARLKRPQ